MGWTYTIETKNGTPLLGDHVFDREYLAKFMGLNKSKDFQKMDEDGYLAINRQHVQNAITFLEDFQKRVLSMPWDKLSCATDWVGKAIRPDPDNPGRVLVVNGEAVYDYHGSPNNVALFKEVEKVLAKDYHFTFPWDEDRLEFSKPGVQDYIDALEAVLLEMDSSGINEAKLISY